MKKRFLAALLTFCMLLSIAPCVALGADGDVTTEAELTAALSGTAPTITLGADIACNNEISITRDVTIDFNSHKLSVKAGATGFGDSDMIWLHNSATTKPTNITFKNGILDTGNLDFGILQYAGDCNFVMDGMTVDCKGTAIYLIGDVTLNNCALTGSTGVTIAENSTADLIVTNCEINTTGTSGGDAGIFLNGSAAEAEKKKVILEGTTIISKSYGIVLRNNTDLEMTSGMIIADYYGITTNGKDTNTNIVISGGSITSTGDAGLYLPARITATISNAAISGKQGIVVRGCNLTINGGTITASGIRDVTVGDAAYTLPPAAVVLDKSTGYAVGSVTITGGTIKASTGKSSVVYADNGVVKDDADGAIEISGGEFSTKPSDTYIVPGKEATQPQAGGNWIVGDIPLDDRVITGSAPTMPTIAETIAADDKSLVETALNNSEFDKTAEALAENERVKGQLTKAAKDLGDENVQAILDAVNKEAANSGYDKIQAAAYFEVTAESYTHPADTVSGSSSFTLNIEPRYKFYAVKENGTPVEITEKYFDTENKPSLSGLLNSITGDVELTIGLPAGFANVGETVYINHKSYVYTAKVQEVEVAAQADDDALPAPTPLCVTFTNPHGFSRFEITTQNRIVAEINDTYYASLQEAVDQVPENGSAVITLGGGMNSGAYAYVSYPSVIILLSGDSGVTVTEDMLRPATDVTLDKTFTNGVFQFTEPVDAPGEDKYTITVNPSLGGTVTYKRTEGTSKVVLNVKPAEGYKLATLSVTDTDGNAIALIPGEENEFIFSMPESNVMVNARFTKSEEQDPTPTVLPFFDVREIDWFYDSVLYVYKNNLFNGITDTFFGPNEPMSRGMLAVVLYRMEGEPGVSYVNKYKDVAARSWFADAVSWASENGIVTGYGDGRFGPDDSITREQLVLMLRRYAVYKLYDTSASDDLYGYSDRQNVSVWALGAVRWAVGAGIMEGSGGMLRPGGNATRAEVAEVMRRFCERG